MKAIRLAAFVIACFLVLAITYAKPKKPEIPAVFESARSVYVEAIDGDSVKPGLDSDNRKAINDVQESLRQWNRYSLATDRSHADLVFVIRKGRVAGAQAEGGGSSFPQPRQNPNGPPNPSLPGQSTTRSPDTGINTEISSSDDLLRIYMQSEGRLTSIVWTRELEGGLDAPGVQLIRQLKAAVEKVYPQPPAASQP